MGPQFSAGKRAGRLLILLTSTICATYSQTARSGLCSVTAVPLQVRAEGVTGRVGDIVLQCSGATPGTAISGNLAVGFGVSVTNRIDPNGFATDAVLAVDSGTGFVPTGIGGQILGQRIDFNGVAVTVPASGNFNLKISDVRVNAWQFGTLTPPPITASLSFAVPLSQSQVRVAYPVAGLLATIGDAGISCQGSPVPSTLTVSNLFAAGTAFASTRVTEGFGSAFQPRAAGEDNGTRIIVTYSGVPDGAALYLPDYVAGSDALTPTAGGDMGVAQNSGQYLPGSNTLLLVRVPDADSNGAGGTPAAVPTGVAAATLNSVTAVPLSNGSGYAVYEVADASPTTGESAQFPVFVAMPRNTAPATAQESVSFAPVATVFTASQTAPVPRFAQPAPPTDCSANGDCQSSRPPSLAVDSTTIHFAAIDGVVTGQPVSLAIHNAGGGDLNWKASVRYSAGSGWLSLDATSGMGDGVIHVSVKPQGLAPGYYPGEIFIDGGQAGGQTVQVFLGVGVSTKAAPPTTPAAPPVTVSAVVNAASFQTAPAVSGSLSTVTGSNLAGKNVSVTFDGLPAVLLYTGDAQINLQVPDLGGRTSANMVVTVDGSSSAPLVVPVAPASPAIFPGGVLNQDNSANSAANGAARGSILQIFATGIPAGAAVAAQVGERRDLVPIYAGPAPTLAGVQQVNVAVPGDAPSGTAPLVVCATAGGQQYCSPEYPLAVH